MNFALNLLYASAQVVLTVLAARRLGACTLRLLPVKAPADLSYAIETGLGLMLVSLALFAGVSFHLVSMTFLRVLLALLAVPAVFELVSLPWKKWSGWFRPENRGGQFAAGILFLYGLLMALFAGLPPTLRDELIYHLEIPKRWILSGGAFYFKNNVFGYFPHLGEHFFLLGLGGAGETAARLYHLMWGGLLGGALFAAGRRYLSRENAGLAVFIFFTVPSVMVVLPAAYVDLTFTFFTFLALVLWLEYLETDRLSVAVLAGLMMGGAAATKYTGIQVTVLLVILGLLVRLIARRKPPLMGTLVLGGGSMAFAAVYLVRNLVLTGWPVMPFSMGGLALHDGLNWDPERASLLLQWLGTFGIRFENPRVWEILLAPLLVFLFGEFNSPRFYQGVAGPVFLLTPLILFRAGQAKSVRSWIYFAGLFLFYWAVTTRQVRFLFPALPVLALLLAYGVQVRQSRVWRGAVVFLSLFGFFIGCRELAKRDPVSFWTAKASRADFLSRNVSGYPALARTNELLSEDDRVYLINMKNYGYYLERDFESDFIFERYRIDRILAEEDPKGALQAHFRSLGVTYLLIDRAYVVSESWGLPPAELEMFKAWLEEEAEFIFETGPYALYRLYG